jgi:hypothetical protein
MIYAQLSTPEDIDRIEAHLSKAEKKELVSAIDDYQSLSHPTA